MTTEVILHKGPFINTYTGKKFHFLHPHPDEMDIEDIAHALSNQCRFTGHTKFHYSIAQHTVYAYQNAPASLKRVALLHEASEAYILDVATPLKRHLGGYTAMEMAIMKVAAAKYQFEWPAPIELHKLDKALLITEMQALMPERMLSDVKESPFNGQPNLVIEEWSPRYAEKMFLDCFYESESLLTPATGTKPVVGMDVQQFVPCAYYAPERGANVVILEDTPTYEVNHSWGEAMYSFDGRLVGVVLYGEDMTAKL